MTAVAALVAHAGGTGWDEIVVFLLPVVVLGVLQFVGRRKRAAAEETGQDAPVEDGEPEG
jgi:hypothetical protein